MRNIFLSAGHGGSDPGASGNGYIERDLAIELRILIANELKAGYNIDAKVDPPQNALAQTLAWLRGKFGSKDILFDIHWNAGPELANGTEVIVPDVYSQFELKLSTAILQVFTTYGFKSRGVKKESQTPRKKLGWMRPNAENVLIEVCFISNKIDMKIYQANKYAIAKKIAKVLNDYSKI